MASHPDHRAFSIFTLLLFSSGLPVKRLIAFFCLFAMISVPTLADTKEITSLEVEDRDLIRHMYEDDFIEYADEEAALYLERYPEGLFRDEVLYIRAQIAVKEKRVSRATYHLSRLIQNFPESIYREEALYYSGILYIQDKNPALGQTNLDQLLTEFPETEFSSRARYQLGQIAFAAKDWTKAEHHFKRMTEDTGLNEDQLLEVRNLIAWAQYFQGKDEIAESSFEDLINSDLSDDEKAKIAYQLAIDAYKDERYQKALDWFQRIRANWPTSQFYLKATFWKAETIFLMVQQSPEQIDVEIQQEAIQLYTDNLNSSRPIEIENSHYHRGWLLLELGETGRAEVDFRWLQESRESYARDLDLTYIRARYFESDEDWSGANKIYEKSLSMQTESTAKQQLLLKMVRNDFRMDDCDSLQSHSNAIDLSRLASVRDEIYYYRGKCHFDQSDWRRAARFFNEISLTSRYAVAIFEDYLVVFQKTNNLEGAIRYLDQVEFLPDIAERERILLYKTEFQLSLKQWLAAIQTINQILALDPSKNEDPLFILNLARLYDQILKSMKDPEWLEANPSHQTVEFYSQRALVNYELAYKLLPETELENRLAILDLLMKRYERSGKKDELISTYERLIEIIPSESDRDMLIYELANLLIKNPATRRKAIFWLKKLHLAGTTDSHIHASVLLAELYISQEKIPEAIIILRQASIQPIEGTEWFFDIRFRLGELYQYTEQWEDAIEQYDLIANSDQNHPHKSESRERSFKIKKFLNDQKANSSQ